MSAAENAQGSESASSSSAWPLVVLAVIVLVLVVAAVVWWVNRGGGPGPDPHPAPAPEPGPEPPPTVVPADLPAPTITRVRRTPHKRFEIRWRYPDELQQFVAAFGLERSIGSTAEWAAVGETVAPDARSIEDRQPLEDGVEYRYRIRMIPREGGVRRSMFTWITWRDVPVPPTPQGLAATVSTIDSTAWAELTWVADANVSGWVVMVGAASGLSDGLRDVVVDPPLRQPRCLIPLEDIPDPGSGTVTFHVAAVDAIGQEGIAATVDFVRPPIVAAPTNVRVTRSAGGPITVSWDHSGNATGFHVFDREALVAGESLLDGTARRYEDPVLAAGREYRFSVQAVGPHGIASERVAAEPFDLDAGSGRDLYRVNGLRATWRRVDDAMRVRLEWNAPRIATSEVSGYRVRTGAADRSLSTVGTVTESQLEIDPPLGLAAHVFAVEVLTGDTAGPPVFVDLPSPGTLLASGRLSHHRMLTGDGGPRVQWMWRYDDTPVLAGFRLWHNGQQVADETTVGRNARTWTSGVLPPGMHRFRIEAVMIGGSVVAGSTDEHAEQAIYVAED